MAAKVKNGVKKLQESFGWQILSAVVYAAMLVLVLMFFTGNGQFLYEI